MKTSKMLLRHWLVELVGLLLVTTTGCIGPYFSSQKQYDKGRWWGLADHHEVGQIDRQRQAMERGRLDIESRRMALEKLNAQPIMVGVMTATGVVATAVAPDPAAPAGLKGIVVNFSQNRRYNFTIRPVPGDGESGDSKTFYLGPGQKLPDEYSYLLPGRYVAIIDYGGQQIGQPYLFDVGVQEKIFLGEKCHWYLVAEQ